MRGGGTIYGDNHLPTGQAVLQIKSSEVTFGFSGGPIWDEVLNGVVGMVSAGLNPQAELSDRLGDTAWAVPAEAWEAWVLVEAPPDRPAGLVSLSADYYNHLRMTAQKMRVGYNPQANAALPDPFLKHPDAVLPELENLIGRQTELKRALALYHQASYGRPGGVLCLTGRTGYGVNALGRLAADLIRRDKGRVLITRFWPGNNPERTRRDPRWREGFDTHAEVFAHAPNWLKRPDIFPVWAWVWQMYAQAPDQASALALPTTPTC